MRLLIWLVLLYVGYRIIKGFLADKKKEPEEKPSIDGEEAVRDPVCGIYVAKDDAVVGNLEGQKIHFCSMECLNKFQEQLQHRS